MEDDFDLVGCAWTDFDVLFDDQSVFLKAFDDAAEQEIHVFDFFREMVDIQALIAPGQTVDDLLAHGLDLLTRDHFNKVFEETF
jgi:hypothetical protein